MRFAKTRAHIGYGFNAHLFQRRIHEHRAVKARRMMPHLSHDIGVAQHHHRGIGFRAGGKATGVAR